MAGKYGVNVLLEQFGMTGNSTEALTTQHKNFYMQVKKYFKHSYYHCTSIAVEGKSVTR